MKKLLSSVLAAILAAGMLTACGSKPAESTTSQAPAGDASKRMPTMRRTLKRKQTKLPTSSGALAI